MEYASKPPRYETASASPGHNNRDLTRLPDHVKPPAPMTARRSLMLAQVRAGLDECEQLMRELDEQAAQR